ncbi:MAG: chromosomal replication initiator protein DnaA [Candidatus Auribacterota bacterium]|jgi:hypothetical protein|nr:chromosomal replication initiator protein DnaA [Candidatus Auribacterota bacterium]
MSEMLTTNENGRLVPYYRFDNFVAGDNNHFALAFARAVSESPGKEYNPLFIYSNVGLGKTHLINAIGNKILELSPDKKVSYIASAQFEAELVDAIQYGTIDEFRNRYNSLDLLILDDIQFLASKESAQQEFFHAFNELFNKGKQIVISSDRPPRTLSTLEKRLRSRFEGGIITEIMPPNFETRQAILRKKLEEKRMLVPDEVIALLCKSIEGDIRKLEGALKETLAFAKLSNQVVTYDLAKQVIKQKLSENIEVAPDGTVVNLESPNDSVNPEKKAGANPLKININLPPTPKKKKSLIKESTKNISMNSSDLPMEDLLSDDDRTTQVAVSEQELARQRAGHGQTSQPTGTSAFMEALKKNMDAENGISLTSMFASQNISQHVDKKQHNQPSQSAYNTGLNQPPTPKPQPAPNPAELQQPPSGQNASVAPNPQNDKQNAGNDNVSLTNIFSSREVKEKIHKIIAIGADNESGIEDNVLGASSAHRTHKNNVFQKEHKKKLHYELKHFDGVLKQINKGKIHIYFFEAFDEFSDKLTKAHEAYAAEQYQHGLDCIRGVKKAFGEMTVNKGSDTLNKRQAVNGSFSIAPLLSRTAMIISGLVGVAALIAGIVWFLFFGSY